MKRENAGLMVVILDWFIMMVMTVGIIRLRWYEAATCQDMKNKKLKIEDFSIHLPEIPIDKS